MSVLYKQYGLDGTFLFASVISLVHVTLYLNKLTPKKLADLIKGGMDWMGGGFLTRPSSLFTEASAKI